MKIFKKNHCEFTLDELRKHGIQFSTKFSEVRSAFSLDACTSSIIVLIFLFMLSIFIGLVPGVVNSAKLGMMDSNGPLKKIDLRCVFPP